MTVEYFARWGRSQRQGLEPLTRQKLARLHDRGTTYVAHLVDEQLVLTLRPETRYAGLGFLGPSRDYLGGVELVLGEPSTVEAITCYEHDECVVRLQGGHGPTLTVTVGPFDASVEFIAKPLPDLDFPVLGQWAELARLPRDPWAYVELPGVRRPDPTAVRPARGIPADQAQPIFAASFDPVRGLVDELDEEAARARDRRRRHYVVCWSDRCVAVDRAGGTMVFHSLADGRQRGYLAYGLARKTRRWRLTHLYAEGANGAGLSVEVPLWEGRAQVSNAPFLSPSEFDPPAEHLRELAPPPFGEWAVVLSIPSDPAEWIGIPEEFELA